MSTNGKLTEALKQKHEGCSYSYHKNAIDKGELGEISKIQEELNELEDAITQGNNIMTLIELSDLYGSIECFLLNNFPGTTMEDLRIMSDATQRSFVNGFRK